MNHLPPRVFLAGFVFSAEEHGKTRCCVLPRYPDVFPPLDFASVVLHDRWEIVGSGGGGGRFFSPQDRKMRTVRVKLLLASLPLGLG